MLVPRQNLDRQIDALNRAGCRRIFADKKSSKNTDRPELAAALKFLAPGDLGRALPGPLRVTWPT